MWKKPEVASHEPAPVQQPFYFAFGAFFLFHTHSIYVSYSLLTGVLF